MNEISPKILREKLLQMYRADPERAEANIEAYLQNRLAHLSSGEKIQALKDLCQDFPSSLVQKKDQEKMPSSSDPLGHISRLLLGRHSHEIDLSSPESLQLLSQALNTLLETLNDLIQTMHIHLHEHTSPTATIRTVIASQIQEGEQPQSLSAYLNQIKEAFLIAHISFEQSCMTQVQKILQTLSPDSIETKHKSGLRFGALKKADLFDQYKHEHEVLRTWFDSGRCREDLLREFEKTCHTHYANKE